jgi:KDO2-lipid IV(A) lauroyltransferase
MRKLSAFYFSEKLGIIIASKLALAVAAIVAFAPRRARQGLGDLIGLLWFDALRIRRDVALANLRIAFPEWTERQRVRCARASLRHMGRTITDFAVFPFFDKAWAEREFDVVGRDRLEQALSGGRGALLFSLHLGNGDFAVAAYSRMGIPVALISKFFRAKWLNDAWFGMRARHGTRFIAPEKSSFEILRALKRGEAVIFVIDQFMGPPIGVKTRFFGKETGTAAGLALMADRTRLPVLPVYTFRQPNGRSTIVFDEPIPFVERGAREENIAMMTQAYADKLEQIIRRHPEQWMWIHRRWKEFGNEGAD